MYKVRVVLLLCLFFICDSIVPMKSYAASYQKGDIMLKLNNSFLIYSNQGMPFVKNERTYIPLRMINEIMGAEIEWLSNEKKVRIFSGADKVIVLKVNSLELYVIPITGLNKEELKQHEVHEDKIITFGELKGGDYKGQIYVFVNYFKTKAGSM